MIIDSHQHVCWHHRNTEDLIADMDANRIDTAWLLTWEIPLDDPMPAPAIVFNPVHRRADGTHPGLILSDIVEACRRYPQRFVAGYCPDPLAGDAPGYLEAAHRMHRVRVCGEWKFRVPIDDPRCLNLFRKAGELKMPVVLHLDVPFLPDAQGRGIYQRQWYGGTVQNLERALNACPQTNFISHAPGVWREISGDADREPEQYPGGPLVPGGRLHRMLEQYGNLYADLSAGSCLTALKRDEKHAREFLIRFADKLLFGRDQYGNKLQEFLQSLHLPEDVQRKLYSENATKLLSQK